MKWLKRMVLKIWDGIIYLFGGSKMNIEDTVDKWFEEAKKLFDNLPNPTSKVNKFCLGTFRSVGIYLNASCILQERELYYPAMALIRITSDLLIKFLWCLQGVNDKAIEERIVRWEKTTFKEQKRFLSELKEVASGTEKKMYEKGIDDLDKKINNGVKEMPNTRQIFKECKKLFSTVDIYPKAYQQYNQTVHIDVDVLDKIMNSPLSKDGCDKDIVCSKTDIEGINKTCLIFLYMLLIKIYEHYSWDATSIKKEILSL